jgi:hypothetical protein
MRKNTRVSSAVVAAAALMGLMLTGCATSVPESPYGFKHSIFGDELVPLSPDKSPDGQ